MTNPYKMLKYGLYHTICLNRTALHLKHHQKLARAQSHYRTSLTAILQQAQIGVSADCDDWKVILAPSTMLESTKLAEILTEPCTLIFGEANIITSSFNQSDRSILINLQNCDFEILLTYEESVELSTFPKESLTLRQALNFPTIGGQLYRIARGLTPIFTGQLIAIIPP